jgi:hypothetical protein
MSGALTNSIIVWAASSLASPILYVSSSEKVAKYLVKNLKESFAELEEQYKSNTFSEYN